MNRYQVLIERHGKLTIQRKLIATGPNLHEVAKAVWEHELNEGEEVLSIRKLK